MIYISVFVSFFLAGFWISDQLGLYGPTAFAAWLTPMLVVSVIILAIVTVNHWLRGALWAWLRANPLLVTASALLILAFTLITFGWWKTGVAMLVIALALFIRYSCRWGNWCRHVGPWWENEAWPAIRRGWHQAWGWSRVIVRRHVVPFIVGMFQAFRPWVERNFWLLLSLGFGLWAYYLYGDSLDWDKQSKWFYVASGASFVAFVAWSSFTRRLISGFVHWVIELFESGFRWLWVRFSRETSGFGKAITGAVAVLGLAIVSSFLQELFHRNSGWLFQALHINMYAFGRVTWGGVALVAGVFTVATVALMLILPDLWPKKRPATPAAPARPAPPNNAARAAAAERHARRAARQARIDFLRANP